jgi:hypothetical protein
MHGVTLYLNGSVPFIMQASYSINLIKPLKSAGRSKHALAIYSIPKGTIVKVDNQQLLAHSHKSLSLSNTALTIGIFVTK